MSSTNDSRDPMLTIAVIQRDRFLGTDAVIRRIYQTVDIPFELLLIAGNMPQRYVDDVHHVLKDNARVIPADEFLTANAARNIALAASRTKYFCAVENNIVVYQGWLDPLLDTACRHPRSVVTPLLYHGDRSDGRYHFDLRLDRIEKIQRQDGVAYRVADVPRVNRARWGAEPMQVDAVECHIFLGHTDDLRAAGVFDPRVTNRDCYDLSLSLRKADFSMYFDPRSEASVPVYTDIEKSRLNLDELDFWFYVRDIEKAPAEYEYVRDKWNIVGMPSGIQLVRRWHYLIEEEIRALWQKNRVPRYYFHRLRPVAGTEVVDTEKQFRIRNAKGCVFECNPQATFVLQICTQDQMFERLVFALKLAYPDQSGHMIRDVAEIVDRFIEYKLIETQPQEAFCTSEELRGQFT